MTMWIFSFFGSRIFWKSWTMLRCFKLSRMLLSGQLLHIHNGCAGIAHTSASICFRSFSVIRE